MALDLGEEILLELRALRQEVKRLGQALPTADSTWLTPSEMAELVGVTTRTLQNYVTLGRLTKASYRMEPRGKGFRYSYHRELALRDLRRA